MERGVMGERQMQKVPAERGNPALEEPTIAAVDVGSNSIKMTVACQGAAGGITVIAEAKETVRLGAGTAGTGRLAPDRMAAALAVLEDFAALARRHGATRLVGVATEAVRAAEDGQAFLARVRAETGWEIRLVSGEEEAALGFRGLAAFVDLGGHVVVADVGGGSTEVTIAVDGAVATARSLPLGSGSLTERFVSSDPPTTSELAECVTSATEVLTRLRLPPGPGSRLIVAGGTGEYMSRLVPAGRRLNDKAIAGILGRLSRLTSAELAQTIGIPAARARVLPAGVAVVSALAVLVHPGRIEVGPSGLRMGVLLAAFAGDWP